MKHILNVLVQDRSGVLVRVAGLFSRRGYNINSLTVGSTENPGVSCMTIVVEGDDRIIEQVTKQLHKVVEVLKINDVTKEEYVGRELLMLKVLANKEDRVEIMHLCEILWILIRKVLLLKPPARIASWTLWNRLFGLLVSKK